MKKKLIGIAVIAIMLFGVFGLTACNESGFEIGFHYPNGESSQLGVAAKSDKTKFDIDDVTIEFSFGWHDYSYADTPLQIKYVMYFFENTNYNHIMAQMNPYDLSNNIEKAFFVKEILTEDFFSSQYEFQLSKRKGKEFNFSEMLTVPKEALQLYSAKRGELVFMLAEIVLTEDNIFLATNMPHIVISYEYINECAIKIKA